MSGVEIRTFVAGFFAGLLTPLLVEFLKRKLFDRPQLRLSATFGLSRPDDVDAAVAVFHVHAVNTSDVPVILTAAFFGIRHGRQKVSMIESGIPGLSEQHDFPIKLMRHEEYTQSVDAGLWLEDFLESRLQFYDDDSDLDYARLEFDFAFLDTTQRYWRSKRAKLQELELKVVRRWFAARAKEVG